MVCSWLTPLLQIRNPLGPRSISPTTVTRWQTMMWKLPYHLYKNIHSGTHLKLCMFISYFIKFFFNIGNCITVTWFLICMFFFNFPDIRLISFNFLVIDFFVVIKYIIKTNNCSLNFKRFRVIGTKRRRFC